MHRIIFLVKGVTLNWQKLYWNSKDVTLKENFVHSATFVCSNIQCWLYRLWWYSLFDSQLMIPFDLMIQMISHRDLDPCCRSLWISSSDQTTNLRILFSPIFVMILSKLRRKFFFGQIIICFLFQVLKTEKYWCKKLVKTGFVDS